MLISSPLPIFDQICVVHKYNQQTLFFIETFQILLLSGTYLTSVVMPNSLNPLLFLYQSVAFLCLLSSLSSSNEIMINFVLLFISQLVGKTNAAVTQPNWRILNVCVVLYSAFYRSSCFFHCCCLQLPCDITASEMLSFCCHFGLQSDVRIQHFYSSMRLPPQHFNSLFTSI